MSKTPATEALSPAQVLVTFSGDLTLRASDAKRHPDMLNIEVPVALDSGSSYRLPSGTLILGNTEDLPERLEAMAKVITDQAVLIRQLRAGEAL